MSVPFAVISDMALGLLSNSRGCFLHFDSNSLTALNKVQMSFSETQIFDTLAEFRPYID